MTTIYIINISRQVSKEKFKQIISKFSGISSWEFKPGPESTNFGQILFDHENSRTNFLKRFKIQQLGPKTQIFTDPICFKCKKSGIIILYAKCQIHRKIRSNFGSSRDAEKERKSNQLELNCRKFNLSGSTIKIQISAPLINSIQRIKPIQKHSKTEKLQFNAENQMKELLELIRQMENHGINQKKQEIKMGATELDLSSDQQQIEINFSKNDH